MKTTDKIDRLKRFGYRVIRLGKNIEAKKGTKVLRGSINKVHKEVFSY